MIPPERRLLGQLIDRALELGWDLFGWFDGSRPGANWPFHHFAVTNSLDVRVFLRSPDTGEIGQIATYPVETILFGVDLSFLRALLGDEDYEAAAQDLVLMDEHERIPWLHEHTFARRPFRGFGP